MTRNDVPRAPTVTLLLMLGLLPITGCDGTGPMAPDLLDGGASGDASADASALDAGSDATTSDAGDSGGANDAGPPDPGAADACSLVDRWTCVTVPATGPYGTRTFQVPAEQNWINSGLYLRAGERVQVSSTGTWMVDGRTTDSGGLATPVPNHSTCPVGALAARVGLHYKDTNIFCGNGAFELVAPRDGIVYVGAFPGNDLGETYESRAQASGALEVTLTSQGSTVPSVRADMAATYPYPTVASGWVEIVANHAIMTLPTSMLEMDRDTIVAAAGRLDAIYEQSQALRGAVPFLGQRIRFFPDETTVGWMLAGNPIRMQPPLVQGDTSLRISRAGETGFDPWGFAHEVGHTFNHINAVWTHQLDGSLEVWPNVFTVYAFEQLGLPTNPQVASCATRGAAYKTSGTYADLQGNVFLWLCFFLELKEEFGWPLYQRFYTDLNGRTNGEVGRWSYVFQTLSTAAGRDLSDRFDAWRIPRN